MLARRVDLAEHEDVLAPELRDLDADLRVHVEVLQPSRDLFANRASREPSGLHPADVGIVEASVRIERHGLRQVVFAEDDDVEDVLGTGDILAGAVERGGDAGACGPPCDSNRRSVVISTMSEPPGGGGGGGGGGGQSSHPDTLRSAPPSRRSGIPSWPGLPIEVRPFDPERAGGVAHLPGMVAQHPGDELALERASRVAKAAGRTCRNAIELDFGEDVFLTDDAVAGRGEPIESAELGECCASTATR